MSTKKYPSLKSIRQQVKELKKTYNLKTHEAYEKLSQELDSCSWRELKSKLDDYWSKSNNIDLVSLNKRKLTNLGVEFSVFEPTPTGLRKSILDATQQVRTHFEFENFHYYYSQRQGPEFKIVKSAVFLGVESLNKSKVSLYRPKTKLGDPRMWFSGLGNYAEAGEKIAIIIKHDTAYLVNISRVSIDQETANPESTIGRFLSDYLNESAFVANELLSRLKDIAKAPFRARRTGDTAIGFTLETLLGIAANSSKQPDYKGIELKSGRGSKNRSTLFAQVADWSISPAKKSAEILDKFGYERGDDFKLYCTVSSLRPNSQGLIFKYNEAKDQLEERTSDGELIAIWPGQLLRDRLLEKHAETFWIEAESYFDSGVEYFRLISVTHTKRPIVSQFMSLIDSGIVTMDHLIKRSGKTGRVSEKGPLFKIDKKNLNQLFPEPSVYSLI